MMCAAQISGTGEQEMKKHLHTHLGLGFCPTQKNVSMFSEGHGVVHYNSIDIDFTFEGKTVKGSEDLQCTITPKVHLMLEHVEWQMANIEGGLGDKMEDWVERLHQTGKRQRVSGSRIRVFFRQRF